MEGKLNIFSKKLKSSIGIDLQGDGVCTITPDGVRSQWQQWSNGPWWNVTGWSDRWNNSWSNGGCYITTACVEHMGLKDDCDELTTMRSFRDEAVEADPEFRKKVLEYYENAPHIVEKINESPDRNQILDRLYQDMIKPCVNFYKQGEIEKTKELYLSFYENLLEKYPVVEFVNA